LHSRCEERVFASPTVTAAGLIHAVSCAIAPDMFNSPLQFSKKTSPDIHAAVRGRIGVMFLPKPHWNNILSDSADFA
jgi:hypothetical protein